MRKFMLVAEKILTTPRTKKKPDSADGALPFNFSVGSQEELLPAKKAGDALDEHSLSPSPPALSPRAASDSSGDADSIEGLEQYLEHRKQGQEAVEPAKGDPDRLPSPRGAFEAPVHMCPPSARDCRRVESELSALLASGQLPAKGRLAALLARADALLTPSTPRRSLIPALRRSGSGSGSGFLSARSAPHRRSSLSGASPAPAVSRASSLSASKPSRASLDSGPSHANDARNAPGSGADAGAGLFAGLELLELPYERLVGLCEQLLEPLPLPAQSPALSALRSKAAGHLLGLLGGTLERVLESLPACDLWAELPYPVVLYLLEQSVCDRGETLFDLAWCWLSSPTRKREAAHADEEGDADAVAVRRQQQRQDLADVVWRLPLAADFLDCMAANLPWAAQFVAASPRRPAEQPPTLDGCFSFSVDYDLHDLMELSQAVAGGETRPSRLQRQSFAVACGGYAWYTILTANPAHSCFELYVCANAISLHREMYQCTLHPAADVALRFPPCLGLVDWAQANTERVAACHTHWGGGVFRRAAQPLELEQQGAKEAAAGDGGALAGGMQLMGLGEQPHQLDMEQLLEAVRSSCPYAWGGSLSLRVHVSLTG